MPRGSGFLATSIVVLAMSGVCFAADGRVPQDLENAEQALVNLDYDVANKGASQLLKQRGLTHDQLVRALRVMALTSAVLDRESAARDAFQELLTIDPEYKGDPNLGPKVQGPFMEARGFLRAQGVQPGMEASVVLPPHQAGTIRVTTRDPTHLAKRAVVGFRWGGGGPYTTVPIAVGDGATADVPIAPTGTTRLDYYAQAFDANDGAVFEVGNPVLPKSATVDMSRAASVASAGAPSGERPSTEEHKTIFASPVFWLVAGAVVIGAGTTTYLVATHKTTQEMAPPTQATLSPLLQCGAQKCN